METELLEEPQVQSRSTWKKYHTWQNYVGGLVMVISYACCIPGLFYYDSCCAWTLQGGKPLSYSAYGMIDLLWNSAHNELVYEVDHTLAKIPAILIFIFSICMPFIKLLGIIIGVIRQSESILWVVARVSKFQHMDGQIVMLLFSYLQLKPIIYVKLESGFYMFLAYCIMSSAGVQIILSQFVNKEEIARKHSTRRLWWPVAVAQMLSIVVFFFCTSVMTVDPVDPSNGLHLSRIQKSMLHVLLESDWFVATWLMTTVVILPCLTYIILPALLNLGSPALIRRLGGRESLHVLMEYIHDWSLGDVLLLAWTCMWLIVLSIKWTNPEMYLFGGYFMIFFGISSGFMIYLFQLNACMEAETGSIEDPQQSLVTSGRDAALGDRETESVLSHRDGRCRCKIEIGPQPLRRRIVVYVVTFTLYAVLAGYVLHVFMSSSKAAPNLTDDIISLNKALHISLEQGGAREGLLHTIEKLLRPYKGSIGSCAKKGQPGGPPGNLHCQDVPSYSIGAQLVDGMSISAFNSTHGGPIYNTTVSPAILPSWLKKHVSANVEVSFVTGLDRLRLDRIELIDGGIFNKTVPSPGHPTMSRYLTRRRIQLGISFVIDASATSPDERLPITVHVAVAGKSLTKVPCCNPERLTAILNFTCKRSYPFFSFDDEDKPAVVTIEPPDALSLRLFGNWTKGIGQATIEDKLAQLVAQFANKTINTSSLPQLQVFYPYETFSLADGLSFLIRSNLPISDSTHWDFCPEEDIEEHAMGFLP